MSRQDCTYVGPDGDFHFIDWGGAGPPAHFSHATGLCAGVYTPLAERLRPELRMIGLDDRGHGSTRIPANPDELKDWNVFRDDLEGFFDYLQTPLIAIGHSRGATVSLLLAVRRPELIRALILIDPTILPYSWMWWWYLAKRTGVARWMPIVATAARRRHIWPDRESILNSYRHKAVFNAWKDGFLEAYIANGTEATAAGTVKLCCQPAWESKCFSACPHDIWQYVPRLKTPTLVIYGAQSDTFRPAAVKRFKSALPQATLRCFEKTGHFVPMERPDETAQAIVSFLREKAII